MNNALMFLLLLLLYFYFVFLVVLFCLVLSCLVLFLFLFLFSFQRDFYLMTGLLFFLYILSKVLPLHSQTIVFDEKHLSKVEHQASFILRK